MTALPAPPRLPPVEIIDSQLLPYGGVLGQAVGSEPQRVGQRQGLLLLLTDASGAQGIGELCPLPGYSKDRLSDGAAALAQLHRRLDGVDAAGFPQLPGVAFTPSAAFALECALLDLVGRRSGCSAAELLRGQPPLPSVELNALVGSMAEAEAAWGRGIRVLKVKVSGRDWAAELTFLRALRQRLGATLTLRIDANGSFSSDEARQRLAELAALRPQFVEQPTDPAQLAQLGPCAVPWAADESLQDPQQLAPLLDAAGCVAWVLKPALLGLRRARELALLAQQRGLGVVITHLFDGPVGLAAACELALSLPTVPWACGLDRHPGLAAWPAVALPHHRPNSPAAIQPHGGCGLGFALAGLPWG